MTPAKARRILAAWDAGLREDEADAGQTKYLELLADLDAIDARLERTARYAPKAKRQKLLADHARHRRQRLAWARQRLGAPTRDAVTLTPWAVAIAASEGNLATNPNEAGVWGRATESATTRRGWHRGGGAQQRVFHLALRTPAGKPIAFCVIPAGQRELAARILRTLNEYKAETQKDGDA